MNRTSKAVELALSMAADPAHGYDQSRRWGPDYDCSSFLITVWESVGVPVKSSGASYTGNMRGVFLRCGFADVTDATGAGRDMAALRAGDVLLNCAHHTAMYVGNGQVAEAALNENGGVTGGQSGDQTDGELRIRGWYVYPSGWDCVLRFAPEDGGAEEAPSAAQKKEKITLRALPTLSTGAAGDSVRAGQYLLLCRGLRLPRWGADGEYGEETESAVRAFQRAAALETDGVLGEKTWAALTGRLRENGTE